MAGACPYIGPICRMRIVLFSLFRGIIMSFINQKTLVRYAGGFVNVRTHFLLMTGLWWRRKRTFFIFEDKEYSYWETRLQARRFARFFLAERKKLVDAGKLGKKERMAIAIYQENNPEYLFAYFGAALANCIVFAVNTGFRGEILSGLLNQSKSALIITDPVSVGEVLRIMPEVAAFGKGDIYLSEKPEKAVDPAIKDLGEAVEKAQSVKADGYRLSIINTSPMIVIYTSGMTGLPKGVPCTHIKLFGAGLVTEMRIRLNKHDRGYISMPLFHSNAHYIGIMPLMLAGGSFVLKRKFSASAFEEDMLKYGVTYLNYVGQPLHYIIAALEKKYGSGDAVEKALAKHPNNRFKKAHGNGASVVDRKKLMRYLNMYHIYELYGSTEAPITTANKPGDPIESVGQISDAVVILNEEGNPCPPGKVDAEGKLLNYEEAVGEICKKMPKENVFFDGYFDNAKASESKFRGGYFHSGDLGHVRIANGKRYMFFNGRTDDWIRKDGENFSAENVLHYAQLLPGVSEAIAFGAPCEVSDEKVMIVIQMDKGKKFDSQAAYDYFMRQQKEGGMDPKWMPDYIRVIDAFPVTTTQKIVVRPFKKQSFDMTASSDLEVYFRRRGDTTYHRLDKKLFEEVKKDFEKTGRLSFLCLN
jgi:fatty-acyl-CoA synthase